MVGDDGKTGMTVTDTIQFNDGSAYERYMGRWSQLAGAVFLDWLSLPQGYRWLDVGCGNGAFTELLIERCAPSAAHGIDPSEAQLAYARAHVVSDVAEFHQGDAMALPFPDGSFDVAVMPLVIFFVPDPLQGVREMTRVVSPGGVVAAYAWDMPGGGFPYQILHDEIRALGFSVPRTPNADVSAVAALLDLWTAAGLTAIETRQIPVQRTFVDFADYWTTILGGASVAATLAAMPAEDLTRLESRLRMLLRTDADGRIVCTGLANAIKGVVDAHRQSDSGGGGR
jgi:SAM-dependent methyltransferase